MTAFYKSRLLFLLTVTALLVPAIALAATTPLVQVLEPVSTGVSTPLRLASDRAGNIYLTDPRSGGVLKFNSSGLHAATFTVARPQGLAITDSGDLVIGQGDSAVVLSQDGQERFRLGRGAGQFKKANGITVDAAGYIYVVDSIDNCIQVFTSQGIAVNSGHAAAGKPANSFGSSGSANGQLTMPTGIAYEKVSGQLAVADTGNGRIQFFDTAGTWKRSIGSLGGGVLNFSAPVAVTFEYSREATPTLQRMYVADSFQSSIQVLDPATNPVSLGYIGGYGRAKGKLLNPADALFDPLGGRLLVANGFGNITVYGINGGGTPIVDTTPPLLAVNPAPTVTALSTLLLSGTIESDAALTVTTDTAAIVGAPQITASGAWTVTLTALVPGTNGISVTATDRAGNVTTRNLAVTYSNTAVNLTIDRIASPVNSPALTITGAMDAGATVTIALSTAATAGTVTYPTTTTWRSTITGLVSGENIITVTAAKAGSVTAVNRAAVVFNNTPPVLNLSMLADGSTTNVQLLTVVGLTAVDIATVNINGEAAVSKNGVFSKGILLAGGVNTIVVTATDVAGNTTSETRRITYDPAAPTVLISTPTAGKVTNQSTLQISGTSFAGSSTVIKVNGAVQANLLDENWTTTVNLISGTGLYTIEATARNGAGSKTASTAVTIYLVDLTVPVIELVTPPGDTFTDSNFINIFGNSLAATVTATIGGVAVPIVFHPSSGEFVFTPTFPKEGSYSLIVTSTDAFGSSSSVFRTIIYDRTPPVLTIVSQSLTGIAGRGEPDATVFVKDANGVSVGTAVVRQDGSWNVVLTGAEALPLDVYALDGALNNTRNGDINGNGTVDLADVLKAMRIAIKLDPPLDANGLLHADVGPVDSNGVSLPDGKIDIDDVVVILKKTVGIL